MEVVCAGNLVADIFANPVAALPAAGQFLTTSQKVIAYLPESQPLPPNFKHDL